MEGQILLYIQNRIRVAALNPIVVAITSLGNAGWFWLALSILLFLIPKTRHLGVLCCCSMFFMVVLNNMILKNLVDRIRPFVDYPDILPLGHIPKDSSFPSGHTAASFAVATVILCRTKKRFGIPAIILATLIALSRLYVGVHYPTDVLGGFVMGLLCSFLGMRCGELLCAVLSKKFPSFKNPSASEKSEKDSMEKKSDLC